MHRRRFLTTALLGVGIASAFNVLAGELAVLLASTYRPGFDPAQFWVSEKLDGVRAIWDGQALRFRSGNPVDAPRWFIEGLPSVPLDGELWLGRGRFERISAIVRRSPPDDSLWRDVRYMVFELPGAPGSFTERIDAIRRVVAACSDKTPWLQHVEQFRIANENALKQTLGEVVAGGGEGLVLHRADAPYMTGRGDVLLKMKPLDDAEARVIAHLPGAGHNTGRMGALLVETPEGRRFRIGTGFTNAQREAPPPIGSVVTYRYRGFTNSGLPRFASFLRVHEHF